jgi:drug/metabolite transporter (DMT)-like permease
MAKIIIALYVLATSFALVALKWGSKSGALISNLDNKFQLNLNIFTFAGIFLYGVSFIIYTFLIARYDLGYIIPLATAFVYIAIFTASYFIFNETFTVLKIFGILLITLGLVLLNLKK